MGVRLPIHVATLHTTTYDYNLDGNLTTYIVDQDGDGEADSSAEYSYTDNQVVAFTEDQDNDGIPNIIIAYSYDEHGNRTSHNIDLESNGSTNSIGQFREHRSL